MRILMVLFTVFALSPFFLCGADNNAVDKKVLASQEATPTLPEIKFSNGRRFIPDPVKFTKTGNEALESDVSCLVKLGSSLCKELSLPDDIGSPEAAELIRKCLKNIYGKIDAPSKEELKALADAHAKKASPSPALDIWIAYAIWASGGKEEDTKQKLSTALTTIQKATHHAGMEFIALSILGISSKEKPKQENIINRRKTLVTAVSGELNSEDCEIFLHLFVSFYDKNDKKTYIEMEKLLDATPSADPWFAHCIKGESHIRQAWDARGDDWASSVSEEGWEGFRKHLKIASENLTKAWMKHPERPWPAATMITVAMGSCDSDCSPLLWLQRALMARSDHFGAYDLYLFARRPRWGGSYQEMLMLGEECLATGRFDTKVPSVYLHALYMVAGELNGFAWRKPFRLPNVQANLETLFDGLLKARGESAKNKLILQYAFCMSWAGNYQKAEDLLGKLPKDFDTTEGINSGDEISPFLGRKDLEAEIKLFLGPQKEFAQKWQEALLNAEKENTKELASAILSKTDDAAIKNHVILNTAAMLTEKSMNSWNRYYDRMPIFFFMRYPEALEFAVKNGMSPDQLTDNGNWTPFSSSVRSLDFKTADLLLSLGAGLNTLNSSKEAPIIFLARYAKPEAIEYILAKGISVNTQSLKGTTPIAMATFQGNIPVMKLLIVRGADINLRDTNGFAPIFHAVKNGNVEAVNVLTKASAELDIQLPDGTTPLMMAVSSGKAELVKALLDGKANINGKNTTEMTALHIAAKSKKDKLVKMLLDKGADKSLKDKDGKTALDYANNAGDKECIALLSK